MFRTDGPAAGELRVYIPEAMGNRDLLEPLRLTIRNPTEAQKREIFAQMKFALRTGPDGMPLRDENGKPLVEIDMMADVARRRRTIEHCLVRVENFERRGPSGEWVPVTEKDFCEHAPSAIFDEVADEALTGYSLSEDAKKNSARSSDSTPARTPPSDGTAETARRVGSVSIVGVSGQQTQAFASSQS